MDDPNEELTRLSLAIIAETWGNQQEFSLQNPPARNSAFDYYVERALSERIDIERTM